MNNYCPYYFAYRHDWARIKFAILLMPFYLWWHKQFKFIFITQVEAFPEQNCRAATIYSIDFIPCISLTLFVAE